MTNKHFMTIIIEHWFTLSLVLNNMNMIHSLLSTLALTYPLLSLFVPYTSELAHCHFNCKYYVTFGMGINRYGHAFHVSHKRVSMISLLRPCCLAIITSTQQMLPIKLTWSFSWTRHVDLLVWSLWWDRCVNIKTADHKTYIVDA